MKEQECMMMTYMNVMNPGKNCCPMMNMPEQQLEQMYPKIYFVVFPVVQRHCDMMDMNHGCTHVPCREEIEEMSERVCKEVEGEVETIMSQERSEDDRQLGFGGRRVLRNLVEILLIRELLRRRRFGNFYGGFYGGYPGYGFGGYPGFGRYYGF